MTGTVGAPADHEAKSHQPRAESEQGRTDGLSQTIRLIVSEIRVQPSTTPIWPMAWNPEEVGPCVTCSP